MLNPKPMSVATVESSKKSTVCMQHRTEKGHQHPQMGLPTTLKSTWQGWEEMKSVYFLRKSHIFILMGTYPLNKHWVREPTMCQTLPWVPRKVDQEAPPGAEGHPCPGTVHGRGCTMPWPHPLGKGNLSGEGDIWAGSWRMSRSFQLENEANAGRGVRGTVHAWGMVEISVWMEHKAR